MHIPRQTSLLAALCLLLVPAMHAETAADLSGHWEGSAQLPNTSLAFVMDLVKNGKGELAGTFSSPNVTGLPLSNFAIDGKSVLFQIKGAPGERGFKATLAPDGKSMSGTYAEGGYTMPFEMARTGDAHVEAAPKIAAIGKELEGTWNGVLEADGKKLRLALIMANQPDGTAAGTAFSIDEGLEIPISAIKQKGASVTLEFKAVGSSFSGELKAGGSEMAGTYAQREFTVPVTFRHAGTEAK
jgi:hypothetical protein